MKTFKPYAVFLCFTLFFINFSYSSELNSISALFSEQVSVYPQEKLYVQTDKP